jgi:hypothetical protein
MRAKNHGKISKKKVVSVFKVKQKPFHTFYTDFQGAQNLTGG